MVPDSLPDSGGLSPAPGEDCASFRERLAARPPPGGRLFSCLEGVEADSLDELYDRMGVPPEETESLAEQAQRNLEEFLSRRPPG